MSAPELLVNIDVEDLDAAVDFYCSAFGLAVGRRLGPKVVELLGANARVYLLANPPGSVAAARARRDYARHWTPVHLDFVVPDLDAALARAESAGAVREGGVRTDRWGRIATLADPFGNGFCLIQFLGKGYGEVVG